MTDPFLEKYTEIHLEGSPATGWWATCSAMPDQAWQDASLERLIARIEALFGRLPAPQKPPIH